jgi:hypothetical protein
MPADCKQHMALLQEEEGIIERKINNLAMNSAQLLLIMSLSKKNTPSIKTKNQDLNQK